MGKQNDRTVFVVGAGASHEFGLPVGKALQTQIHDLTLMEVGPRGPTPGAHNSAFADLIIRAAGRTTNDDLRRLLNKTQTISDGVNYALSIDNYLDANQKDAELVSIGKLAIATCISKAEADSTLAYTKNGVGFEGPSPGDNRMQPYETWIGKLTSILASGHDFASFCKRLNLLTFVCFNYDRCIERYLAGAASLIYPKDEFSYQKLFEALNIIHPYGTLGSLDPDQGVYDNYGRYEDGYFLLNASKNIKTFTEGMDSSVQEEISSALSKAQHLIFLGYGFIKTNDRFMYKDKPFEISSAIGTVYGLSAERIEHVKSNISENCLYIGAGSDGNLIQFGNAKLHDETCSQLVDRYLHVFETIGSNI